MVEANILHKIRKVVSLEKDLVNVHLDNGWILLNIHTVNIGDPQGTSQYTVFTLGNTDPNADSKALVDELNKKRLKEFHKQYPMKEL